MNNATNINNNYKKNHRNSMIIMIVFIALGIIGFILLIKSNFFGKLLDEMGYRSSSDYMAGKYNCYYYYDQNEDFDIVLELNKDKTFLYGPYEDTKDNYAKGTYTYKVENKETQDGEYKYYLIHLNGEEDGYVVAGEVQDHKFEAEFDMGVKNHIASGKKKEAVIMFTNTYNTYYCIEK